MFCDVTGAGLECQGRLPELTTPPRTRNLRALRNPYADEEPDTPMFTAVALLVVLLLLVLLGPGGNRGASRLESIVLNR